MPDSPSVRLDKWLWAARFFKTRSLATEAIKGGKVRIDGLRSKPAKIVEIGQTLSINKLSVFIEVVVIDIIEKRFAYDITQSLYKETEASVAQREKEKTLRKLANQGITHIKGRPTKRDRRKIVNFTRKTDD